MSSRQNHKPSALKTLPTEIQINVIRRLQISCTSFLRSSRWWQVFHWSVFLYQSPQQCSAHKNYVHMNLVLNVHTSLHYNLQGIYKINTHHAKNYSELVSFSISNTFVFTSFEQITKHLNKGGLNLVLTQNLFPPPRLPVVPVYLG